MVSNELKFNYTLEKTNELFAKTDESEIFASEDKQKLAALENYNDSEVKSQTFLNRSTLGYQRKNLLKNTAVSNTQNGVTFTVNADESVTINGTNAGTNSVYIKLNSKFITTYGRKYTASIVTEEISGVYMIRLGQVRIDAQLQLHSLKIKTAPEITDDSYEPYKPSVEERLAVLEEKFAALEGGGT